ncbi:MAG: hypothetical protein A2Z32_03805 [Chloroflexi bacterium RBG_16_69_14]|nr:MAG: hypothetical protein A2Z32_03805 [Chloroflexi bacterium RBG_16_69_14]
MVVGDRFEIEGAEAGRGDRRQIGRDRRPSSRPVEQCSTDEAAVELRPLELVRAGISRGDLDPDQTVLESAVAAALDDRAVAGDDGLRLERHGQPAAHRTIVEETAADRLAGLSGIQAEESEGVGRAQPLGRVGAAQRRFDQFVGELEAIDRLAPDLEEDGVTNTGRDGVGGRERIVEGRSEIGRTPFDRRRGVEPDHAPVDPCPSGLDPEDDGAVDDAGGLDQEAIPLVRGDRRLADADDVRRGRVLPVDGDHRLGRAVGVQRDPPLLIQDAGPAVRQGSREIAQLDHDRLPTLQESGAAGPREA